MSNNRYIGTGGRITFRSGVSLRDFSSQRLAFILVLGIVLYLSNPGNECNFIYNTTNNNNINLGTGGIINMFQSFRQKTFQIPILGIEINISSLSSKPSKSHPSSNDNKTLNQKYNRNYNPNTSHHYHYGTNYHLFTLTKTSNGLDLGILNNNLHVCDFNSGQLPHVCRILSNYACSSSTRSSSSINSSHTTKYHHHQAFQILRILQLMKIASFLLQFCYKYNAFLFPKIYYLDIIFKGNNNNYYYDYYSGTNNRNNNNDYRNGIITSIIWNMITKPLTILSSVFHETYSIRDIISLSLFVYPSLVTWEQIMKSTTPITTAGTSTLTTTITIIMILLLGGFINLLSSIIVNDKVGGMKGFIALSLGFSAAINPNDIFIHLLDIQLTAGEVLFSVFAITFIPLLFGFQGSSSSMSYNTGGTRAEWEMGNIMSWSIGGLIGYLIGEYQKDRLVPWIMKVFS